MLFFLLFPLIFVAVEGFVVALNFFFLLFFLLFLFLDFDRRCRIFFLTKLYCRRRWWSYARTSFVVVIIIVVKVFFDFCFRSSFPITLGDPLPFWIIIFFITLVPFICLPSSSTAWAVVKENSLHSLPYFIPLQLLSLLYGSALFRNCRVEVSFIYAQDFLLPPCIPA